MPEKSPRRLTLEAALAADPTDAFLRYGLAMECLKAGDLAIGREGLHSLIADRPDEVAAYQQLGQSYLESDDLDPAREILQAGIARAKSIGDHHAAGEMEGLLAMVG